MLNITRNVENERVAQTHQVRGRVVRGNVGTTGILGTRLSDWLTATALTGWYASFLTLKHQPACSVSPRMLPCHGNHLPAEHRDASRAYRARGAASYRLS